MITVDHSCFARLGLTDTDEHQNSALNANEKTDGEQPPTSSPFFIFSLFLSLPFPPCPPRPEPSREDNKVIRDEEAAT